MNIFCECDCIKTFCELKELFLFSLNFERKAIVLTNGGKSRFADLCSTILKILLDSSYILTSNGGTLYIANKIFETRPQNSAFIQLHKLNTFIGNRIYVTNTVPTSNKR